MVSPGKSRVSVLRLMDRGAGTVAPGGRRNRSDGDVQRGETGRASRLVNRLGPEGTAGDSKRRGGNAGNPGRRLHFQPDSRIASRGAKRHFPLLAQAASWTGEHRQSESGYDCREHIANASPAADSPPALLAYDAELELVSARGNRRRILYRDFHLGYKRTALAAGRADSVRSSSKSTLTVTFLMDGRRERGMHRRFRRYV
jgi:hypothetical protein